MIAKFLPLRRVALLHDAARYTFICARSNSSVTGRIPEGLSAQFEYSPGRPGDQKTKRDRHAPKPKPQPETPPTEEQLERMQRTLFLGRISKAAKHADVKEFCQMHGATPTRVIMPTDCNNGRNPSHAIVQFASEAAAKDAMSKFQGKNLLQDEEVVAVPVTTDPEAVFAGSKIKPSQYFPDFERDYDVDDILKPVKEGRKIFVGGVWAPTIKSKTVFYAFIHAFRAYAVETMSKIKPNMQGRRHVFIETATREEADRIMDEMSEAEVLGTKLILKRIVLRDEDDPLTMHSTRFQHTPGRTRKSQAKLAPHMKEEW